MAVVIENIETSAPEESVSTPSGVNVVAGSHKVSVLPNMDKISQYSPGKFLHSVYRIFTPASPSNEIVDGDYESGLNGKTRIAKNLDLTNSIGAMVFDQVIKEELPESPLDIQSARDLELPKHNKRTFWEYLSRIWNFLQSGDRDIWESFWDSLVASGFSMSGKAQDFIDAVDPRNASVNVFEYYYDINIDPALAIPTNLFPELPTNTYIIRPNGVVLNTPSVEDGEVVRRDSISIDPQDYHAIRSIAYDQYVVLTPRNPELKPVVLTINELYSSEEPVDSKEFAEYNQVEDGRFGAYGITNITDENKSNYRFLFRDGGLQNGLVSIRDYTMDQDGVNGYLISINKDNGRELTVDEVVNAINNSSSNIVNEFLFSRRSYGDQVAPYKPTTATFPRDRVRYTDMPYYKPMEAGNGRYVAPTSQKWHWFDSTDVDENRGQEEGSGEYRPAPSSLIYQIKVNSGLVGYENESFTIHLTTGRAYNIDKKVLDIGNLQVGIDDKPIFFKDRDFTVYDSVLEFHNDIFKEDGLPFNSTLYSEHAEVINDSLFSLYGGLVNISDWNAFNFDNETARASISALMKSLQEADRIEDYSRALNIYYNMPIAPEDSKVYGVYESYGYEIINVDKTINTVTIKKQDDVSLSRLIQPGSIMLTSEGRLVRIGHVDYDDGTIIFEDVSNVRVGMRLYTGLQNKMTLISTSKEGVDVNGDFKPAQIVVACNSGSGAMQHVIDIYKGKFNGEKYPEVIVYGTEEDGFDNVYHVTKAEPVPGFEGAVRLSLYSPNDKSIPQVKNSRVLYNDYIHKDKPNMTKGFAHFPWPTHKFLLLWLNNSSKFHISYIDTPLDTIYENGDDLKQYQTICRNVSVFNKNSFPGWFQYDQFRFYNGLDEESSIVESTSVIDGADFGTYFPAELKD